MPSGRLRPQKEHEMGGDLLFIHKDPKSTSLSHSDDAERRQVHRHVQLGRLRRKHSPSEPKCVSQPVVLRTRLVIGERKVDTTPSRRTIRKVTVAATFSYASEPNSSSPQGCPSRRPPNPSKNSSGTGSSESKEELFEGRLLMTTIRDNSTDPFNASVVRIESSIHVLLHYFINVSHPRTWHSERKCKGSYIFQQSAFDIVSYCVQSAMSMFTMLASMASQMQYFEGQEPVQDPTGLIQKAIEETRKHIEGSVVDFQLIFGVHSLANAEFYRYNVKAARTHVSAVRALVEQIGGLEALPIFLKEWFLAGDEFIAAETHSEPLWPASELDPGPWCGPRVSGKQGSEFPESLNEQDWRALPSELRSSISDTQDYIDLIAEAPESLTGQRGSPRTGFGHWLHLRVCAIRLRLLSQQYQEVEAESVRLAVLAWSYMNTTSTGRRRTMQVIASRLREILSNADCCCWSRKLHFWILVVGCLASENRIDNRDWFINQLTAAWNDQSSPSDAALDTAVLINILGNLLYFEWVQAAMVKTLAADIAKAQFRSQIGSQPATGSREITGEMTSESESSPLASGAVHPVPAWKTRVARARIEPTTKRVRKAVI